MDKSEHYIRTILISNICKIKHRNIFINFEEEIQIKEVLEFLNKHCTMKIIVNGGTKGIGKEVAIKLAESSENTIVVTGRSIPELKSISGRYENIIAYNIDLSVIDNQLSAFTAMVSSQLQKVDILINMAGLLIKKDFSNLTLEETRKMMETNFFGPSAVIRALFPLMSYRAHIVNISSMGGFQGSSKFRGLSCYSASKAALSCLSECLAIEFREAGIKVNCLALGSAETEMFSEAFPGLKASVTAAEMAELIIHFAMNGSKYFNGKVIPVALESP